MRHDELGFSLIIRDAEGAQTQKVYSLGDQCGVE